MTKQEENKLEAWEKKVPRKIFGGVKIAEGEWRRRTNAEPLFRSLSVDSSRRAKSSLHSTFKKQTCGSFGDLVKEKKLHLPRTRSLPSKENDSPPFYRWFSSKKPPDPEESQQVSVYAPQSTPASASHVPPEEPTENQLLDNRVSNPELQPYNITPIAVNHIRHTNAFLFPSASRYKAKISALQRLANSHYERAVKACVAEEDDGTCRYRLESAQPRENDAKINALYRYRKEGYETRRAKAPQLQPKNIDPYGKLNTSSWVAPNMENYKRSIIAEDQRRSKYDSIFEKRKRSGESTESGQQRKYCTSNVPASTSTDLEKCKAIIAEYKKLNPDYNGNVSKVPSGSEEEKRLLEQTEKFLASVKSFQKTELEEGKEGKEVTKSSETDLPSVSQNVQDQLDTARNHQPKLNLPHPNKEKTVLYYDEKNALRSKIIREEPADNSESSSAFANSSDVKVKVGPKLMLQSCDLNDRKFRADELVPAPNEKFVAPWLSWSDRVKLYASKNKREESIEVPSNPTVETAQKACATPIDSAKQAQIQKRQFSGFNNVLNFFHHQPKVFYDGGNVNWSEVWKRSQERPKSDDVLRFLPSATYRLFSTNSTRGVLGPEGTVMVKLRRLPKINIPEPIKDCEEPGKVDCVRADGVNRTAPRKLPKLILQPCDVPAQPKPKDGPPLPRLKPRSKPEEPPKICPLTEGLCTEKRADFGREVVQKKLPKIVPSDCFPVREEKMTSPPLPRLKARPISPPPPCKEIPVDVCPPRADVQYRSARKKLPPLPLSDCCPECPLPMSSGTPLKRLKKMHVPEPERICLDLEDPCPPRADEVLGYKIKKKKLQSLILAEKYNNLSWKEFNETKVKHQVRNYTTDSKCSMCCYSDKTVHPDVKSEGGDTPDKWATFNGKFFCESDGKMKSYLPPEESIDTSTGSELKIVKKPIGSTYRKDDHVHEDLLKSGFSCFVNDYRKLSSATRQDDACVMPPEKPPYKDLKLKPLKKRSGFDKDFPGRIRFQKTAREEECIDPCEGMERMDDVLQYEVKSKKLPPIPKGNCENKPPPPMKPAAKLTKRLKKRFSFKSYDCPKEECIDPCPPRADDNLVEKYKKLIPMQRMSNCPEPAKPTPHEAKGGIKRLPKLPLEEPEKCKPQGPCPYEPQRSDAGKELYSRKCLPQLEPSDCMPKKSHKMKSVKLRRLPKHPFMEREDDCRTECEVITLERSDNILGYQVKPKKLKSILKSNNKAFSTLPSGFLYKENFFQFKLNRYISSSTSMLNSDRKECKKLVESKVKKCTKLQMPSEKCVPAKSISCDRKRRPKAPCAKQKSPYPAFSECKEHHRPEVITECQESERHLQPRWPIINAIINQKPPPPYQGKIDPSKQEECIAKKLNIQLEGDTKTCGTFDKPQKPVLTKEMYDEVIKNPPFDKCECAEDAKQKAPPKTKEGPCPAVEKPLCPDPEIECELNDKKVTGIVCGEEKSTKNKDLANKSKSKPKSGLTCKKKEAKQGESASCGDQEEPKEDPCREVKKKQVACKSKSDTKVEKKPEEAKEEKGRERCVQPKLKECKNIQNDCVEKKQKCEEEKASKKKKKKKDKGKGGKDKKGHCRNVKACGKGGKAGKKDGKKKGKYPKKCSDLLKEDDKKKGNGDKKPAGKSPQMADLCQKKPCTPPKPKPKPEKKPTPHAVVLAARCPPKKSFWQRIVDFFKARPNCPPPDQWKKDKLRKKAEKAAAAAGLELCERKKPKVVTVTCKKTGVKGAKPPGGKDACKKVKSTCGQKKPPKKSGQKGGPCKDVKPDCKKSGGKAKKECKKVKSDCSTTKSSKNSADDCKPKVECKPKAKPKKQSKPKAKDECKPKPKDECKPKPKDECKPPPKDECEPKDDCGSKEELQDCKVADVVKAKECEAGSEQSCVQETETNRCGGGKDDHKGGGKCKKLPKQKFCKPPFRTSCKKNVVETQCTTVESPYPSFSECKKDFPKLPIDECMEQEKNVKRAKITYDYDDPDKQVRKYSTFAAVPVQRRFYSSNSNRGRKFDPLALFSLTEDSLKDMDDDELALRILSIVKEGMKSTAVQNGVTKRKCLDIFKELEMLCEHELGKGITKDALFGINSNQPKASDLLSDTNVGYPGGTLVSRRNLPTLEQTMMMDAIRNLCKTIFSIPNLSTIEYEESEKTKTEKLQKQLDEMLDNYKATR